MEHASVQMDRHMQQPDAQLVEAVQAHHQVVAVQVPHQAQAAARQVEAVVLLHVQ